MKKTFITIALMMTLGVVNAQWNANGNNSTTGFIKAGAGFLSANPNNTNATIALSWLNNVPRLRIGGEGDGLNTGFQIQTVGDRNLFTINNAGKVGIGTVAPSEMLHVIGDTRTSSLQLNGGNIIASIPNTTGGWARGILYYNPNTYSTSEIAGIGMFGSGLTPSRIFLGFGNDPWYSTKGIQIKSNGYVGVGTTNPLSRLDITNGVYKTYFTGNAMTFKNNDATSYIDKRDGGDLLFRMGINYNSTMIIKNNRNVGIGTTTPSEKLEIYDSTTTPGVISLRSSRNDASYVDVGRISAKQNSTEVSRIGMPRSGQTNTGYLTFWTKKTNESPLKENMRISADGNVGIGTITPDSKLAVNGTIHSKEVRVDLVGWPDYVFTSTYKLPTLQEVEKQIKENGHLANIPSAEEVAKNGIELGEMNKKLLEKVEELTLYIIQQEKELYNQGKEIEELKALVKMLIDSKK